ncbi:hypothetical protein [uncultured Jannaschia sp.]|uniref:hypothetical protein n=1 Tax=uncultured Jannaschia sp. TaxID=293347 RepID=UPI00260160C0|nr:hypothetical protein [uncultured Jannaschia sp.]
MGEEFVAGLGKAGADPREGFGAVVWSWSLLALGDHADVARTIHSAPLFRFPEPALMGMVHLLINHTHPDVCGMPTADVIASKGNARFEPITECRAALEWPQSARPFTKIPSATCRFIK